MGPLPPLDPKICVSAYKLRKKILESSSASASTSAGSNVSEPNRSSEMDAGVHDEDSKTSIATDLSSIDIQSELLKIIEEQKSSKRPRRPLNAGRNPRKSPRQHASTLAILSSLVHHRKKRDLNKSRSSDFNSSGSPRTKLSVIKEENKESKEPEPDYEEIESGIDKMLSESQDLPQLEIFQVDDCVDIRCNPDAIEALESYEQSKDTGDYAAVAKRLLNGTTNRKPGRKKKTNRTGWPNKNRRNLLRKDHSTTREEDETRSVDSLSVNADSEDNEENYSTDVNSINKVAKSLGITKLNNSADVKTDQSKGRKRSELNHTGDKIDRVQLLRKDSTDNCAEIVVASVEDKMDCVNVDLEKWENAEKVLAAKLTNSDILNPGAQFQPFVRVQKLDNDIVVRHGHRRLRSSSSPRRGNVKRPRRAPSSPKSPRMLRKPRGRWYRER